MHNKMFNILQNGTEIINWAKFSFSPFDTLCARLLFENIEINTVQHDAAQHH
jgi:hypothetical protein